MLFHIEWNVFQKLNFTFLACADIVGVRRFDDIISRPLSPSPSLFCTASATVLYGICFSSILMDTTGSRMLRLCVCVFCFRFVYVEPWETLCTSTKNAGAEVPEREVAGNAVQGGASLFASLSWLNAQRLLGRFPFQLGIRRYEAAAGRCSCVHRRKQDTAANTLAFIVVMIRALIFPIFVCTDGCSRCMRWVGSQRLQLQPGTVTEFPIV